MKLNKVFLHVGMQKTATSTIQDALYNNRDNLRENSFLYPASWSKWHVNEIGALLYEEKEEERRNVLHRKEHDITHRNNIIKNLKNELENSGCQNLVISAENIGLFSCEGLLKLKSIFNKDLNVETVVIVFCTRNIIEFMNSLVQQSIKSSFIVNYKELVNRGFYKRQINKFKEIFGEENLIVYSFEDAKKHQYGVVGCFLEKVGFNKQKLIENECVSVNKGISDVACDIVDFVNIKQPFVVDGYVSEKRKQGDTVLLHKLSGKKFVNDPSFQRLLLKNSSLDIQWLKDNYDIDYTNIKISRKYKLTFSKRTVTEIRSVFPLLNDDLQELVELYFQLKLQSEKFYYLNNKRNLKKIVQFIEKYKSGEL